MLSTGKKIVITTETRDVVVVRRRSGTRCRECRDESAMIELNPASADSRMTAISIIQRLGSGEIHFAETDEGRLLVCRETLLAKLEMKL